MTDTPGVEPSAPTDGRPGLVRFVERKGVVTSFAWGFSEATVFFFLPDIAVGAVALFDFKRGLKAVGAAVGGAVVGGLALFAVATLMGADIHGFLTRLPAIPESFFTDVREGLRDGGGGALLTGPWRGIPYKLYAAEWGVLGWNPLALAAWTIPARAARIGLTAILAAGMGWAWRRLFGTHRSPVLLGVYAGIWVFLYSSYFASVGL